jgi:hypothetical protein
MESSTPVVYGRELAEWPNDWMEFTRLLLPHFDTWRPRGNVVRYACFTDAWSIELLANPLEHLPLTYEAWATGGGDLPMHLSNFKSSGIAPRGFSHFKCAPSRRFNLHSEYITNNRHDLSELL